MTRPGLSFVLWLAIAAVVVLNDLVGDTCIAATLSVRQSIGLVADLRQASKGQAFAAMANGGWRLVNSALDDPSSDAALVVGEARLRAGLDRALPTPADFEDRL